jgi:integrase
MAKKCSDSLTELNNKTPEEIKTKGRGRKGKMLYKFSLVDILKPYLELWLQEREEKGIDSEWLFIKEENNKHEQLKISTVNSWAESWGKILDEEFYMHSLRHYWTTAMHRNGFSTTVIKKLQGWQSIEMVSTYLDIELEEELEEFFNKKD